MRASVPVWIVLLCLFPSVPSAAQDESSSETPSGVSETERRVRSDSVAYDRAWRLFTRGEVEAVVERAGPVVDGDSVSVRWHELLGKAHQALGEHREAADVFERGLERDTTTALRRGLAESYAALARTREARAIYSQMAAAGEGGRSVRIRLAALQMQMRDWPAARESYERLLSADTTNGAWHARLGQCYEALGAADEAEAHLRRAHDLRPHDVPTALRLSRLLRSMDEPDAAADVVRASLQVVPQSRRLTRRRADLAFEQDEYDVARPAYERTLMLGDTTATVYRRLGIIDVGRKQHERALDPLRASYSLDSTSVRTRFYLGVAYREVDSLDQSAGHLQAVIDALADRRITDAYVQLAQTRDRQGRLGDALAAYRMARRLQPSRTVLLFQLATLYDRYYRDKTVAARYYEQYLAALDTTDATDTLATGSRPAAYAERRLQSLRTILHMQKGRDR